LHKGKFDQGWDKLREETLARQIKQGIVPPDTKLAPKPADIKDWESLSADEKRLFARQMEVYAGFSAHTDHEIGRLTKAIEDLGELDNRLIFYVVGDNGSSAEGQMNGMYNEMTYFNGVPETVQDMLKHYDEWGSESTYPHFAAGWAVATNAPFQWTKQVASDFGGTRNGLVVHWPAGIKAKGEVRSQFTHAIDIAPTVFEACNVPAPKTVTASTKTRSREPASSIPLLMLLPRKNIRFNILKCLVTAPFTQMVGMPEQFTGRHGTRNQRNLLRKIPGNYIIQMKISVLPII